MLKQIIGRGYLRAFGWQEMGAKPEPDAYVLIAAPHTSNWDLPFMLAISYAHDVPIQWAGKHTLFRFPFGSIMKALGGLAIERSKKHNKVKQLALLFESRPTLVLTMPAEGTRSYRDHWKSGFYHIAREANVPIVCGYLDFEKKEGGFGLTLHPTGDVQADMDKIRAFYGEIQGKFPEKFGPVRLREEAS